MNRALLLGLQASLAIAASPAAMAQTAPASPAADNGFTFHLGATYLKLADEGVTYAGGAPVVGGGYETPAAYGFHIQGFKTVFQNLELNVSLDLPFETSNTANGSLTGVGNLVTDTFAFATAGANWRFKNSSAFEPYIGGGASFYRLLTLDDGVAQDVNIEDAWGTVINAGIDIRIKDNLGLFIDVKKYFIETVATGSLGGGAILSEVVLDPVTVSTGLSLKY
jgi:outer membrane protein